MNAQVQLLTITPEQLKQFEWEKSLIDFDLECTDDIIDQLGTLFCLINRATEEEENNLAVIMQIRNLARLGHFTCDSWGVDTTRENLKKLSPLTTPEA